MNNWKVSLVSADIKYVKRLNNQNSTKFHYILKHKTLCIAQIVPITVIHLNKTVHRASPTKEE